MALSRDFRAGVPWELFFADDLVIIATSLEECIDRVKAWKEAMESKVLRVNMGKTKFVASGIDLDVLRDSGKFHCAACRTGVGHGSGILCTKCVHWVHRKCAGQKTLNMYAHVAGVTQVYILLMSVLSKMCRLVTAHWKILTASVTWATC